MTAEGKHPLYEHVPDIVTLMARKRNWDDGSASGKLCNCVLEIVHALSREHIEIHDMDTWSEAFELAMHQGWVSEKDMDDIYARWMLAGLHNPEVRAREVRR